MKIDKERYMRQIILDEIGEKGQEKLSKAKVLIIGLGGLGAPVSLYLTAAGVGTLGLAEYDKVDISNLQRQIIYTEADIGLSKNDSAVKHLEQLNSKVNFIQYKEMLTETNALKIFKDYDYVIDATDNFQTKFLINDTCKELNQPYVYGSIYNFEGQVSIFCANGGPTYRSLNKANTNTSNLTTNDLGVFGVLPGVIGCIQATETIKLICNIGEPLIGKMLIYDALEMRFQIVKIPNC
jgi:molybdopterin/thiamine biosynthesis adenylyltransferase